MKSSVLSFIFFAVVTVGFAEDTRWSTSAEPCSERVCQLPDCFCSGTKIPGNLPADRIPQFVMLTFDDSINPNVNSYYSDLFFNRTNPDKCPIRGTFYVTHEWNDYWLTKKLYREGHEIADHSVTHETTEAFKNADVDRWAKEICGMKKILEIFGQIRKDDVRGFRAPYLQVGGDKMFEAMAKCGDTYDTTMPAAENDPPMWPYTLDYKSTQECKIGPCPKNSHPGLWEVPMVYYNDAVNRVCAMVDACCDDAHVHICMENGTRSEHDCRKEAAFDMLLENFARHYLKNRAPFPMFMHAGWFTTNTARWEALNDFIDTILEQPDVYFVTVSDVLEWMKDPKPCIEGVDEQGRRTCTLDMPNWSCHKPGRMEAPKLADDAVCQDGSRQHCVHDWIAHNTSTDRRFTTCYQCPPKYPWLGNPDGDLLKTFTPAMAEIPAEYRFMWSPPRGITLTKPVQRKKAPAKFNPTQARQRLLKLLIKKLADKSTNSKVMRKVLSDRDQQAEINKMNENRIVKPTTE